jgi:hypothetical protein
LIQNGNWKGKIYKIHEAKESKIKRALQKPSVLAKVLGRERRRRRRESVEHKSHEQRGSRSSMCRCLV